MILSFCPKTNNAYADEVYSYPRYLNRQPLANSFSIVNDWREFTYTYDMTSYQNVDWGSFKLTYGATDNYGEDFDIWFTIKVTGGTSDGRIIYDSGWVKSSVDNVPFNPFPARYNSITIYFRVRYGSNSQSPNPPALSMWTGGYYTISFSEIVTQTQPAQTTAIPSYWAGTETQTTATMPDVVFKQEDFDDSVNYASDISEDIQEWFATTFGILDSGESLVVVINYIQEKFPYIYAITAFSLLTAVAVWCIK